MTSPNRLTVFVAISIVVVAFVAYMFRHAHLDGLNGLESYRFRPVMTPKEVAKELERNGWAFVQQTGSHRKYRKNAQICIVPMHSKDLKKGTLSSIKKQISKAYE